MILEQCKQLSNDLSVRKEYVYAQQLWLSKLNHHVSQLCRKVMKETVAQEEAEIVDPKLLCPSTADLAKGMPPPSSNLPFLPHLQMLSAWRFCILQKAANSSCSDFSGILQQE